MESPSFTAVQRDVDARTGLGRRKCWRGDGNVGGKDSSRRTKRLDFTFPHSSENFYYLLFSEEMLLGPCYSLEDEFQIS